MADSPPARSSRFPEELDDKFVDYRDERGMTNSEALRSLVRSGLQSESEGGQSVSFGIVTAFTSSSVLAVAAALFALGMIAFGLAPVLSAGAYLTIVLAVVGGGFYLAGLLLAVVAVLARVAVSSTASDTSPPPETSDVQA